MKGAVFSPTLGVKVCVGDLEYGTFHPTTTCAACHSKWEASGLEGAIYSVNWDLVRSRRLWYVFMHLCVGIYIIYTIHG